MNLDSNYTLYFNNDWLEADQIGYQFMEHTAHFENGISQEIRSYEIEGETHIFKAKEHFAQLLASAKETDRFLAIDTEKLVRISYELLRKNHLTNATIHALIYARNGETNLVMTVKKSNAFTVREELILKTTTTGCISDEKLCVNESGNILSDPSNPFFFIKDGILYTPSVEKDRNPGILRNSIIECAIQLGCPVIEKSISVDELEGSEAAFFSNYTNAINLVNQVNGYSITSDWRNTIVMDLLLMFRQQSTHEDFCSDSII